MKLQNKLAVLIIYVTKVHWRVTKRHSARKTLNVRGMYNIFSTPNKNNGII